MNYIVMTVFTSKVVGENLVIADTPTTNIGTKTQVGFGETHMMTGRLIRIKTSTAETISASGGSGEHLNRQCYEQVLLDSVCVGVCFIPSEKRRDSPDSKYHYLPSFGQRISQNTTAIGAVPANVAVQPTNRR